MSLFIRLYVSTPKAISGIPLPSRCLLCLPSLSLDRLSQYLELLSVHEELLQLLAQQEVVRKTLLGALKVTQS